MRRSWLLGRLAALALAGAAAACSPGGAPLEPSVSSVSPPLVFLARTVDVHLAGFATRWSDATTVDFGDGVTVNHVTAASPTALTANVTVAAGAAVGKRDVVVTDGAVLEPFKATFEIAPPIKLTIAGIQAQGSIFTLHADDADLSNLFDTTSVTTGFFGPPTFVDLAIAAPMGAQIQVAAVTPFAVDATVLVDVNAPPAPADLDAVSGPMDGAQTHFPAPGALDVRARAPAPLSAGPSSGTVERAFDSSLFTFAPRAGASIQDLDARAAGAATMPAIALLPKSGAFADLLSFGKRATVVSTSADPFYVIYWDNSGASGYDFTLTRTETAAAAFADADPADDARGGAVVLSLPAVVPNAELLSFRDQDWFVYTAGAGDAGRRLHVQTVAGDPLTDTVVDVLAADGVTSLGGPSSDFGYHEDLLSDPLPAAGAYYVRVYASPTFDPMHRAYQLAVRLQ